MRRSARRWERKPQIESDRTSATLVMRRHRSRRRGGTAHGAPRPNVCDLEDDAAPPAKWPSDRGRTVDLWAPSKESIGDQDDCCATEMQMLSNRLPGICDVCAPCSAGDGQCDAAFVGLER